MLVVSIVGKDVYQDNTIICVLNDISNLYKVRHNIYARYDVLFADQPTICKAGYEAYDVINKHMDVRMVVENVPYICDDDLR